MKTTMTFGEAHVALGVVEIVCMNDVEESIRVRVFLLPPNQET